MLVHVVGHMGNKGGVPKWRKKLIDNIYTPHNEVRGYTGYCNVSPKVQLLDQ